MKWIKYNRAMENDQLFNHNYDHIPPLKHLEVKWNHAAWLPLIQFYAKHLEQRFFWWLNLPLRKSYISFLGYWTLWRTKNIYWKQKRSPPAWQKWIIWCSHAKMHMSKISVTSMTKYNHQNSLKHHGTNAWTHIHLHRYCWMPHYWEFLQTLC